MLEGVELLLAERACERLMVDYAWCVDSGNASKMPALFTEDGVWTGADGRGMNGRDEITRAFEGREKLTRRQSRHVITNQAIDMVDDDNATGRCYLLNYRHDSEDGVAQKPAPAAPPKFIGEYHLEYRRTPDGWRIRRLRFDLAFLRKSTRAAG